MNKNNEKDLIVGFPNLFKVFMVICGIITFIFFIVCLYLVLYNPHYQTNVLIYLLLISSLIFYYIDFRILLFYKVISSKKGLKATNLFSRPQFFKWEDIIEVRRPVLGIPRYIAYVISKDNKKMLLIRKIKDYDKLINIIKERALNLRKYNP
jgi:hypothetical protein